MVEILLTCTYLTKNSNSSNSHFTGSSPRPWYGILWKRPFVKSWHAHIQRQRMLSNTAFNT